MILKSDGSWISINQLKKGDLVSVAHFDENGNIKLHPSPILAIDVYQYFNAHSPIHYREIFTQTNESVLHITPSHSLLARKKHKIYAEYLFAEDLEIGDDLYFVKENKQSIVPMRVTDINDVMLFDAYAPLTLEGNVIVNEYVVSCYGTFDHHLGHLIKLPRRWWLYSSLNYMSVIM